MAGQRLDRRDPRLIGRARPIALVSLALGAAGCGPAPPMPEGAVPLEAIVTARSMVGPWDWVHYEVEDGTLRRERERWRFEVTADPRRLVGHYHRDVLVRALDAVPFTCNQKTRYHQRAEILVGAEVGPDGVAVAELSYLAEPGPCDPGLRQLGSYVATIDGDELHLSWGGGVAILTRTTEVRDPIAAPTPAPPSGRWSWRTTSWTRSGLIRHELEDWELAVSDDGLLAGTYVREVTERSPDGADLPCAGAPGFGFADRYLLRGRRSDDRWLLEEVSVIAGEHPCLSQTPRRTLDAGTLVDDGDHVVVSWRGKRRQVLARHDAE